MQTTRRYVYLLGGAVALAGCQKHAIQPTPLPLKPPATATTPMQQSLSADALFAFGKSRLRSVDNTELNELSEKMKAASHIHSVRVLGYTDRIGSEQANQTLSALRAEAVRDYLVAHGVPAEMIQAEGRGEADPVADCPAQKGRKLIACLAPNRRVVIKTTVSDAGVSAAVAIPPGRRGATRTIWIGPHTVPCEGDSSGYCYRVRDSQHGPWKVWHGRIQGFDYVEGNDYELVVSAHRSNVKSVNPSRDLSSRYVVTNDKGPFVVWVLDHVVSKQAHSGGD